MKYVFLVSAILLLGAAVITARMGPSSTSDVPVLYWVTDLNPARVKQVQIFQKWMDRTHPDQKFDLQIDTANRDVTKRIIQCVSGVGDDVMDIYGGGDLRYMQAMGALRDSTDQARLLDFGADKTYPTIAPEISVPDEKGMPRQYTFPCNVTDSLFFVNKEAFAKYGLPPPPKRWTLEEFEKIGKRFVDAANPDPMHRRVFLLDRLEAQKTPSVIDTIRRSVGLTTFNETGTRCILDRPENARVLELNYKWTYVDHLFALATSTESTSNSAEANFAGSELDMFNDGEFGMLWGGRYYLIEFRDFNAARVKQGKPPLDMEVVEPPNGGFPNTTIVTRAAAVYAGSAHPELASYFLQFLASADYNLEIVDDADSLPPNPAYTNVQAFVHPPGYPTEWAIHSAFASAASDLAIANSYSPFVIYSTVKREDSDAIDAFMSNRISAQQAGQQAADRINDEIQRTIQEYPKLRTLYGTLMERQRQIDALRAAGKKVPLAWLTDPFYRKYYLSQGWAE